MDLNGFIDEERLDELFLNKDISEQEYVKHHSPELLDAYLTYISDNKLPDTNEAAAKFLDEENGSIGSELEDFEEETPDEVNLGAVDLFKKWANDPKKVDVLLKDCEDAAKITLWRYNNPLSLEKKNCAASLLLGEDVVVEWWDTIDFINGSLGGGHFSLVNPTVGNIKALIADAVQQAYLME